VAVVEFAIIVPVLALIVFGTLDFGRAWSLHNRLSNAAREAGSVVQVLPANIDTGCQGERNAVDRAKTRTPGSAR